jgi:heme-degrading monooxygenase HmoA
MTSITALVRHRVADFDAWKTTYDSFAPAQAEHGVRAHQVLRSQEHPDNVIVTHTFDNLETAKAFFAMPELKQAMSEGGVDADSFKVAFYDEIEAGALISA